MAGPTGKPRFGRGLTLPVPWPYESIVGSTRCTQPRRSRAYPALTSTARYFARNFSIAS